MLRVVRAEAMGEEAAGQDAAWFMDYRNADGSTSEMCGNGIRVFGRYLVDHEGVDPATPLPVGTRDGAGIVQEAVMEITAAEDAELVLVEVAAE